MAVATFFLVGFGAQAASIDERIEAFRSVERRAFERPWIEQAPVVRSAFREHLADAYGDRALARASDGELTALLRAADALAFYSQSSEDVDLVNRVLQRLERRGAASDEERTIYFRGLVEVRRFDEARRYSAVHSSMDVEAIPDVIIDSMNSTDGPVVYEVAADAFALRKQRRSLARGIHLVVVAHPLCRYSRDAMQALAADPVFAPLLTTQTTWVAPISRWLYFDTLQAWNADNPAVQVVLGDRPGDWPFIRNWSTPMFYVLKDGQWIGALQGWPDAASRRPQLIALLRAAGLRVE